MERKALSEVKGSLKIVEDRIIQLNTEIEEMEITLAAIRYERDANTELRNGYSEIINAHEVPKKMDNGPKY